ncbi:MAG TPA: peptidylprolyl isomerase [Opitutales bacterium]|nr:peptidylprolyl isomerase [Opitutales bacterium]
MRLISLCFLALCHTAIATPTEPGIFAVFTTNHGEFTCELYYEQAPMTVANFVGLAEGSLPYIDLQTGTVSTEPFYNGLTFHRVIENFMIQGGSPNGLGTDGPGYRFGDEFDPSLTHNTAGILSMANSGSNTNGSQFFITAAPTPHLNFKHSVFGKVVEGLNTVLTISETETDASNNAPVNPVIIESIEIVRNGPDAEAFDVHSQGLPKLKSISPTISFDDEIALHFPRRPFHEEILFWSDDLKNWKHQKLSFQTFSSPEEPLIVSSLAAGKDRQFYRLVTLEHGFVAETVLGKSLSLNAISHDFTFVLNMVHDRETIPYPEPLGTGSLNGESLDLLDYLYLQEPVSGIVAFILEGLVEINIYLQFATETGGSFSGIVDPRSPSPWGIFGTFTLEEIE